MWKNYLEDLYNLDTQEWVSAHMGGFGGIQRGNHFGGEPIRNTDIEVRVEKVRNGKTAGRDEVTG